MKKATGATSDTLFDSSLTRYLPTAVQKQRIQRVMEEVLTELQRYTVYGYYFRGMTLEAMALERGVNKSTVCRTLHRAERRLKDHLQ